MSSLVSDLNIAIGPVNAILWYQPYRVPALMCVQRKIQKGSRRTAVLVCCGCGLYQGDTTTIA